MERAGLSADGQHRVFLVRPPAAGVHCHRDAVGDGAERILKEGARAVAEGQRDAVERDLELCRVRRHLADGYSDLGAKIGQGLENRPGRWLPEPLAGG